MEGARLCKGEFEQLFLRREKHITDTQLKTP